MDRQQVHKHRASVGSFHESGDLLDKLFSAQYFSCLDAASGFPKITVQEGGKAAMAARSAAQAVAETCVGRGE